MDRIKVAAYAKINLTLDVLNKREDNYHNIKSVFQKIDLHDDITIIKKDTHSFELETNVEELNNEENIIYKAYKKLRERFSKITGIRVILEKRIPMQAGLGGGSTDCAAFLKAMNILFELNLTYQELEEIGKNLGADVVPCLYDGSLVAEGIGDIVTPIDTSFRYDLLLLKPELSNDTRRMYHLIDEENVIKPDTEEKSENVIHALLVEDIMMLANNLYNIFENVSENRELIEQFESILREHGALGSAMTGSGSCVYGIFKNKEEALIAYNKLKDLYQVYLCESQCLKKEKKLSE